MENKNLIYKLADISDVSKIVEHDIRHMQEPGFDGLPAHPFYPTADFDAKKKTDSCKSKFETQLDKPFWGRTFVVYDEDKIIAHINLNGAIETTLHRVKLGMGIELPYRGYGIGSKLMQMAIAFSRENKFEYMDLSVFAHNTHARNLYKKFGFVETAILRDWIRMYDKSIDDVQMTLKL